MPRQAVIVFNLGGPDSLEAVEPFLFNLFFDPAIIAVPTPLRWLLAKAISRRRGPIARQIYAEIGGKSPLLVQTIEQAKALENVLRETESDTRVWPCMRYWHPRAEAVVAEVKAFGPDRIVLLPLYPQFSTTTSGSSVREWETVAAQAGLKVETTRICCYPEEEGFVDAIAEKVRESIDRAANIGPIRVLYSAHGLPKKVIDRGDPYQNQVERTVRAIRERIDRPDAEGIVCYQSRVGPLEWIEPSTDAEIIRAGKDGVGLVVVPVAFVSEHSETLVELDIEYRKLAREAGITNYIRVQTVQDHPSFIRGLARLVDAAMMEKRAPWIRSGTDECGSRHAACPMR